MEAGTVSKLATTPESVAYHRFSLNQERQVHIEVEQAGFNSELVLFNDDGVLDQADYIAKAEYFNGKPTVMAVTLPVGTQFGWGLMAYEYHCRCTVIYDFIQ